MLGGSRKEVDLFTNSASSRRLEYLPSGNCILKRETDAAINRDLTQRCAAGV
jgi:hypothetical protein